MNNTIYATFDDPAMAKQALGALFDHGLKPEHISLVLPEGYVDRNNDEDKPLTASEIEEGAEKGITTTTSGDAASGAAKGAGIGLAAGAVAALISVIVPGFGIVLGGGALATALAGAAGTTAAGAIAGGATGFLKDQGIPDDVVAKYSTTIGRGGAVLNVNPGQEKVDWVTISDIIAKYGGRSTSGPTAISDGVAVVNDGAEEDVVVETSTTTTNRY
jgi:hypothetical protein